MTFEVDSRNILLRKYRKEYTIKIPSYLIRCISPKPPFLVKVVLFNDCSILLKPLLNNVKINIPNELDYLETKKKFEKNIERYKVKTFKIESKKGE